MITVTLTQKEYDFVVQAVEAKLDMERDTAFENIKTVNLYPRDNQISKVDIINAPKLRLELGEMLDAAVLRQMVASKFNINFDENGMVS